MQGQGHLGGVDDTASADCERIARDLHDGPLQTLTAAVMRLDLFVRRHDVVADDGTELVAVAEMIRDACSEIRSEVLRQQGGSAAHFADRMERRLTELTVSSGAALRLCIEVADDGFEAFPDAATDLAAVAREAVSNAARHSGATTVSVSVVPVVDAVGNRCWRLLVVDDGTGVATEPSRRGGIHNMHERARRWGGRCRIGPAKVGGTQVLWEIPVDAGRG